MKTELFSDFGVGVGLRSEHYKDFIGKTPLGISWAEVITENYMNWKTTKNISKSLSILEKIRSSLPVALHGVSLSIGSVDKLDKSYLKNLKSLVTRIEPLWVSDHLCWTGVDGENLHDLMPLPYTQEALHHIVKKIKAVQDFLGRRILLENVSSYAEFKHSEMTEWEFISEISERSDCGILLDVNNVYVSAVNHGFEPLEYLKNIPPHRVGQIHLAGHTNKGNYLIDTHDSPVCDDVWNLFRWSHQNIGSRSAMIERDGNIPQWNTLSQETFKIQSIRQEKRKGGLKTPDPSLASKTI